MPESTETATWPTSAPTAGSSRDFGVTSGDPVSTFSTGLIQISGMSTLIGGTGLEELSIGLKAASGLAWAPICIFGILKVVKVWAAGVVPGIWRTILGLRSSAVDDALGFMRWTDTNRPPEFVRWTEATRPSVFMRQRDEERLGLHVEFACGNDYPFAFSRMSDICLSSLQNPRTPKKD